MQPHKISTVIIFASIALSMPVMADDQGHLGMQGQHKECKKACKHDFEARLAALESKAATKSADKQWTWGADIEVEGSWGEDYAGDHTSDIVVATAYLSLEGKINAQLTGFVSFLYEEDDTPFDVDEAYLDFAASDALSFRLGQEYIPFGHYSSHLINDPLTLELGEAVETVAQATFTQNGVLASAYVYAGDAPYNEEDRAEDAGVRLQYTLGEAASGQVLVGVDFATNIADADTLETYFLDNEITLQDNHQGYAVVIGFETDAWGVNLEQVAVLDAFETTQLAFAGDEAKPMAASFDAWVNAAALLPNSTVALAYHQTDEAVLLGLPEARIAVGLVQSMQQDTWSWGVEAFQDNDYSEEDGGTDEEAWGLVVQVAASL